MQYVLHKQVILHAQLLRHILEGFQASFENPVFQICVVVCTNTWIKRKKEGGKCDLISESVFARS